VGKYVTSGRYFMLIFVVKFFKDNFIERVFVLTIL